MDIIFFFILGILLLYFYLSFKKIGPFEWEKKYAPGHTKIRVNTFLYLGIISIIASILLTLDFLNIIILPDK